MKKKVAVILSSLAALVGAFALSPASADAYVFMGSCGWGTTVDNTWHWSPTYGVQESFMGYYGRFRVYITYSPITGAYTQWLVAC